MSDTALTILTISVAISSIALLMNALAGIGTFRTVRKIQADLAEIVPQVVRTLESAQKTANETAAQVKEIGTRTQAVLEAARTELQALEATRTDLTTRAKIQLERIELVLDDSLSRLQEVVSAVHGTVLRPVREVTGIVAGIRTAVQTFVQGRRPSVDRATHDEEMFIG
jgi:DNA anti-recombination protein RmuC